MPSVISSPADATFGALADPTRRRLLELLRDRGRMTAGELSVQCPEISRPAVSRHLKVLRQAGLVSADQVGREWHYRLDTTPLASIHVDWLATFIPLFDETLGRLKIRVESRRTKLGSAKS